MGDKVIKLFRPVAPKASAFREAANMALAESLGLPVPQVLGVERLDGRWGIVLSRVDGTTFADGIRNEPKRQDHYLRAMAKLHLRIHSHPAPDVARLKTTLERQIRQATLLGDTAKKLLAGLSKQPDGDRLCHGDLHPCNIVGAIDRPLLFDWLRASSGYPGADVCRSYVLMRQSAPSQASAYVKAYAELSGLSQSEIIGWRPFVVAARLAEGFQGFRSWASDNG